MNGTNWTHDVRKTVAYHINTRKSRIKSAGIGYLSSIIHRQAKAQIYKYLFVCHLTHGRMINFLETTKSRLEDQQLNLTEQYDNVVNVDMAEAIKEFSWAQYAYNAALKVGTQILSPSFIDFMS